MSLKSGIPSSSVSKNIERSLPTNTVPSGKIGLSSSISNPSSSLGIPSPSSSLSSSETFKVVMVIVPLSPLNSVVISIEASGIPEQK